MIVIARTLLGNGRVGRLEDAQKTIITGSLESANPGWKYSTYKFDVVNAHENVK